MKNCKFNFYQIVRNTPPLRKDLNCGVGKDYLESLGLQGDSICPS